MADQERAGRELRIGDAERTAAADELAEHYAQGRLSAEEHSERLDRVWAARTLSDLAPVFSDLPGSAYQRPRTYSMADRPGVGQDGAHSGRDKKVGPFPGPPFGRPPFGRPPYAGPARRLGMLPVVVRIVLAVVLAVLVLAHLPLIVLALVIWLLLTRKHRRWHACRTRY